MKCNTFILKCFLEFTCTNLDGCQKEGGNFLKFASEREGYPERGEGFPQKRGGSSPGRNYGQNRALVAAQRQSPQEILRSRLIYIPENATFHSILRF